MKAFDIIPRQKYKDRILQYADKGIIKGLDGLPKGIYIVNGEKVLVE